MCLTSGLGLGSFSLGPWGYLPRGSIYTTYGIRPPKNHPCFGFGDLVRNGSVCGTLWVSVTVLFLYGKPVNCEYY